jgi:superfamily II helicase
MKSTVRKTCQSCKVEKSLSDFHRNKTKADGHNGICKVCQSESDNRNKLKTNS